MTIRGISKRGCWHSGSAAIGKDVPAIVMDGLRRGKLKLMPRGGAARLINPSGPEALSNRACHISCFSPWPFKPDLRTSVNGHFVLDHKSRRYLCMMKSAAGRPRETALSCVQSSLLEYVGLAAQSISDLCRLDRTLETMPNGLGNVDQYTTAPFVLTQSLSENLLAHVE